MANPARLATVDHVHIEAPPGAESRLSWFYGDLLGLQPLRSEPAPGEPAQLRFRSERRQLRINIVESPTIDSVDCRLHFEIPSLDGFAETLEEHNIAYEWMRGVNFTDRALVLLDPVGHRVMLRRWWHGVAF